MTHKKAPSERYRNAPPLEVVEVEPPSKVLRAALYARVSTPKQKTVAAQLKICRDRADERAWRCAYVVQDQGLQASDLERPGFQRIMDLAESRAIDVVIVWKIDRLARSLAHTVVLEDMLNVNGVAIHSCTEPIDTTTPIGRFLFGNLANAAQLERSIIRERTLMGVHASALQGKWIQPIVPFGYRRTKGNHLRIDKAEAEVVRAVFAAYQRAQSFAETANLLNTEGSTQRGTPWTLKRVRTIVTNELYAGTFEMGSVRKEIPALVIVPPTDFEAVRRLRQEAPRDGKPPSLSVRDAAIDRVFSQYLETLSELPEGQ